MEKFVVYKDEEAAHWQGMIVGEKYELLDIDLSAGCVPWFKTYQSNGYLGKTRWTSSTCFEEVKGDF